MKVKAPAEKNFRRARTVKPVKRRVQPAWRSWRVLVACAACAIGLYAAYQAFTLVLHASALQVHRIVVRGHVRLSSGEVQALIGDLRGSSILTADLAGYRARLLDSPWVADAALRRVLPSTIEVFVSERTPLALCRIDSQLYLVDRGGTIIDEYGPKYEQFDLPIVDGAVRAPSAGGPLVDEARIALAARVIDDVSADTGLAALISQIDVANVRDAVVLMDGDPALLHVGSAKFLERLQGYIGLRDRLVESVPEIEYADLQFDGRIYVKPAGSTGMRSIASSSRKN
jgi:hypothetical protein